MTPHKAYALTGMTEIQARILVNMAQHLQSVFRLEVLDAAQIAMALQELCAENRDEANKLSAMIEKLHQQVGCCPGCRHKKPQESQT